MDNAQNCDNYGQQCLISQILIYLPWICKISVCFIKSKRKGAYSFIKQNSKILKFDINTATLKTKGLMGRIW
jgi:hypothetical protein